MCIEDVRLGHKARGGHANATVAATAAQFLGANEHRFALLLSGDKTKDITIKFGSAPVNVDDGINLWAGNAPVQLHIRDIGSIIRQPIFAIASVAGAGLGVIESSLDLTNEFAGSPSPTGVS